jgi:hypothetical protein
MQHLSFFWVDVLACHAVNQANERCQVDLCTRVAKQITDKWCRRNLLSETCITCTFTRVPRVALTPQLEFKGNRQRRKRGGNSRFAWRPCSNSNHKNVILYKSVWLPTYHNILKHEVNLYDMFVCLFVCFSRSAAQRGLWPPRNTRFRDHIQRRATFGRTPLNEWSARRRKVAL